MGFVGSYVNDPKKLVRHVWYLTLVSWVICCCRAGYRNEMSEVLSLCRDGCRNEISEQGLFCLAVTGVCICFLHRVYRRRRPAQHHPAIQQSSGLCGNLEHAGRLVRLHIRRDDIKQGVTSHGPSFLLCCECTTSLSFSPPVSGRPPSPWGRSWACVPCSPNTSS